MVLKIKCYKGAEVLDEQWDEQSLEGAKDIVCAWVRTGVADRVEIRDANDVLLFHFPMSTRPGRR